MSATNGTRRSPLGWTGKDLLGLFLTNSCDNHTPRANTGEISIQVEGNVCTVQKDETLPRVFRKLVTENFLAMPVLDGTSYVGTVSILDLVKHVNGMFWGDSEEDWIDYWSKSEDFAETTVGDIVETPDQWNRDPSPTINSNMSTMHALELMANKKLHRMPVMDASSGKLCSILTQSMLISFVRQTKARWGRFADLRVRQLLPDLGFPVVTCQETDTAINAFNKLEDNEISGLAIVNDFGVLKGTLSVRDLRGVGSDGANFFRLYSSVADFKRSARRENPNLAPSSTHYEQARTPVSGLFVTPEQSIEDVIEIMHDGNIHRVFVCTNRSNPVPTHVISQADVLKAVLSHIIELSAEPAGGGWGEMPTTSTKFSARDAGMAVPVHVKRSVAPGGRMQPTSSSITSTSTRIIEID